MGTLTNITGKGNALDSVLTPPRGKNQRQLCIWGCPATWEMLPHFPNCLWKRISSTRMEKQTSRGLGIGRESLYKQCLCRGEGTLNLGQISGGGLGRILEAGSQEGSGRLRADATSLHLLTKTESGPISTAQKDSLYLPFSILHPQSKFWVYWCYFSSL